MAGETEEHLGIDEHNPPPDGGIMMGLPDGRRVILGRGGGDGALSGEWFVRGKDGWPDWDQPVDVRKELNKRPPGRELSQP